MDDTTALDILEHIFDNCLNNFDHNSWIEDADDVCVIAEGYLARCPTPIKRDCHSCSEKEVFVEQLQ